jgi:hypothetical protein
MSRCRLRPRCGTEATEEASFCVFAPRLEGLALQLARLSTNGATEAAKALLKASKLFPKLKNLAKNLATRSTAIAGGKKPRYPAFLCSVTA